MYDKQIFKATCSKCGNDCEVPFKPTGRKPIMCSSCFEQFGDRNQDRRGGRDHSRSGDHSFGRSGDRQMHSAICNNCGKNAEVPFRPTAGKPIYCSDCFKKEDRFNDRRGGRDRQGNRDNDGVGNKQLAEQIKSVSNKLDRLISILDPDAKKKDAAPMEATKKLVAKKAVAKKPTKKATKKTVNKK